jgi:hypothetical protein
MKNNIEVTELSALLSLLSCANISKITEDKIYICSSNVTGQIVIDKLKFVDNLFSLNTPSTIEKKPEMTMRSLYNSFDERPILSSGAYQGLKQVKIMTTNPIDGDTSMYPRFNPVMERSKPVDEFEDELLEKESEEEQKMLLEGM